MLIVQDMTTGITHSMRAAQLDPAIKAISGSPMSVHDAKVHVTFSESLTSPSRSTAAGHPNRATSSTTSPSSGRSQAIRSAPSWRGGQDGKFVQSTQDRSDDPFVSKGDAELSHGPSNETSVLCM